MEKTIVIQGHKIFYRDIGKGKPVMLVHGFGETGDVWDNQVAFLENDFRIIVPDLPGSGRSEMIDDMSMEGMAEMLRSLLDSEGISQVCMIGHSMGGYIVLAFVEKYPGYLNAFGLFHSTAYADDEDKKANRRKGIEFIKRHGGFEFLKTSTPNLFSRKTRDETPQMIHEFLSSLRNFIGEALVSYYEAMMQRPDRVTVLKDSNLPVLFIMGEQDTAVPLSDALEQCHIPGISYIHILENSGHMGMMEEPARSNQALKEFLISFDLKPC